MGPLLAREKKKNTEGKEKGWACHGWGRTGKESSSPAVTGLFKKKKKKKKKEKNKKSSSGRGLPECRGRLKKGKGHCARKGDAKKNLTCDLSSFE